MEYISKYTSPIGEILLSANDIGLTGLWFNDQKHFALNLEKEVEEKETKIIKDAKLWLDIYFKGETPTIKIPIHFKGTPFQQEVWKILSTIDYGKTITYGEIAKIIGDKRGIKRMSAQAVGNAVGRNPISIIVPCHRVLGTNNKLTGYAAGLEKKEYLLKLEKII